MIREDLLEFQYYLDRLSKFMQESYGIDEQVRTFWSLLDQVNAYYDAFYDELDIFNTQGNENHQDPQGKLLDNLGSVFGCKRRFTVCIENQNDSAQSVQGYSFVDLNDEDFLIYIKTQIIKQNFDGRREMLRKLYTSYENGKITPGLLDLRFLYSTEEEQEGAICTIRWSVDNPSANLALLFQNGYLTIESLGIRYRRQITNFENLAYYVSETYALLTSSVAPGDWGTAQDKYYSITEISSATSTWDDTKTYGIRTSTGWDIRTNKPTDWDTAYSQYSIVEISAAQGAYVKNTFFQNDRGDYNLYATGQFGLLSQQPADFPYSTYYRKESISSSDHAWREDREYCYTSGTTLVWQPNQPSNWESVYSSFFQMVPKSDSDVWAADTFYELSKQGGLYA